MGMAIATVMVFMTNFVVIICMTIYFAKRGRWWLCAAGVIGFLAFGWLTDQAILDLKQFDTRLESTR